MKSPADLRCPWNSAVSWSSGFELVRWAGGRDFASSETQSGRTGTVYSVYPRRQLRERSHREAGREGPWPARVGRLRLGVLGRCRVRSSVERHPANPNGSRAGLAGVTAPDGRVTIMMLHPEHTVRAVQCFWCLPHRGENGPWLRTFGSATGCGTCSIRNRTSESCRHGLKPRRPVRGRGQLPDEAGPAAASRPHPADIGRTTGSASHQW